MRLSFWFCASVLLAGSAFADDTVLNSGMYGPEPLNIVAGEESLVQMTSEELVFHFGPEKTSVVARFHFFNPTPVAIHQTIGFPDDGAAARRVSGGDGSDQYIGALEHMRSFVDGRETPSKTEGGFIKEDRGLWSPADEKTGLSMVWHTLAVDFPPGKEVVVERRYDATNGNRNDGIVFFTYIVHTGAAWKGNIGKLQATVFLEGGLRVRDLSWRSIMPDDGGLLNSPRRPEWKIISSKEMTLEWNDFKPSKDESKRSIRIAIAGRDTLLVRHVLEIITWILLAYAGVAFIYFVRRLMAGGKVRRVLWGYYAGVLAGSLLFYWMYVALPTVPVAWFAVCLLVAILLPHVLIRAMGNPSGENREAAHIPPPA